MFSVPLENQKAYLQHFAVTVKSFFSGYQKPVNMNAGYRAINTKHLYRKHSPY